MPKLATRLAIITICFSLLTPLLSVSADDALTVLFQKQKYPDKLKSEAELLSKELSQSLKQKVTAKIPLDYSSAVQAIVSKTADLAYVDSMAYLLARRDGGAELLLAEERPNEKGEFKTSYDALLLVRKDSSIKDYKDFLASPSEYKIAFTSPTSTSGHLMPIREFVEQGILAKAQSPKKIFKRSNFAGSYAAAMKEVSSGRSDICAVSEYAFEGPVAESYVPEAERSQLRVLKRIEGVPTHVLIARAGLTEERKTELKETFLALSEKKPELLSDLYGAARFVEVNPDSHVQISERAIEASGLPLQGVVNKDIS